MLSFNSWGDPQAEDHSWLTLKVGDKCKAKIAVLVYRGRVGTLVEIDKESNGYTVEYDDQSRMTYDGDMLVKA